MFRENLQIFKLDFFTIHESPSAEILNKKLQVYFEYFMFWLW